MDLKNLKQEPLMHTKDHQIIQEQINEKLTEANQKIIDLEKVTHVVSPESTLGDVMAFEENKDQEMLQRELKLTYMRKRRLLFLGERLKEDITLFLCTSCGNIIEIERLLVMMRARLCNTCAKAA